MAVSALVARMDVDHMEYLRAAPAGQVEWVSSPKHAATFETLREATRQAMRLPARMRAFAYPSV